MKRREITIVTNENDLEKTKEALATIKKSYPDLFFTPPIPGELGNFLLLTIKVGSDSFEKLIAIIIGKGLKLFTREDKEKAEEELKKKIAKQEEGNEQFVNSIIDIETPSAIDLFNKSLEEFAKEGNYKALIAFYKGPNQKIDVKTKAKRLMPQVLLEVTQRLYKKSIAKSQFSEQGINKLIKIGHDMELESEGYQKFRRSAAYYAVDLCGIYTDNLYKLIDIANDTKMPQEACLKAAAKFGKVALGDPTKHKTDLISAIRNLNTRWLATIYDTASTGLKDEEINQYQKLKRYLEHERK